MEKISSCGQRRLKSDCACAGWFESSLGAQVWWYVFWRCGSIFRDKFQILLVFSTMWTKVVISVEPQREKTYLLKCAPNEDSNQPAHPCSLIKDFVVRMKKPCILGYPKCDQWRFWSDCARMRRLVWIFAGRTCPSVQFQKQWFV